MSLINQLLKKQKLSLESDDSDGVSTAPVGTTDPTAAPDTTATEPAAGADQTTPAETAAEVPVVDTPAADAAPVATAEEPNEEDIVAAELDDVREEVEGIGSDVEDTVEATDVNSQLESVVASMEALIEKGSVNEMEVRLAIQRGQRRVSRLGLETVFLATESYNSAEGRLETLTLAAESFRETAGRVTDAIKAGWAKLRERVGAAMKRLFNVNEQLTHFAQELHGKVAALEGTPSGSVKIPAKYHTWIADEAGRTINPAEVGSRLVVASKYAIDEYLRQVAASLKAGKGIPKINEAKFRGLPGGLTVMETKEGNPIYRSKPESSPAEQTMDVLPKASLEQVLKHVDSVVTVLKGDHFAGLLTPASVGGDENLDAADVAASHAIDFYFYVQTVTNALLRVVALHVKHYGVQA